MPTVTSIITIAEHAQKDTPLAIMLDSWRHRFLYRFDRDLSTRQRWNEGSSYWIWRKTFRMVKLEPKEGILHEVCIARRHDTLDRGLRRPATARPARKQERQYP
jgi:hypothetical protein